MLQSQIRTMEMSTALRSGQGRIQVQTFAGATLDVSGSSLVDLRLDSKAALTSLVDLDVSHGLVHEVCR